MEEKYKKKLLLKFLMSPLTLLPLVGGGTCLVLFLLSVLISKPFSLLGILGVAGIGFGLAMLGQRIKFGCEKIAKEAWEEARADEKQEKEAALDQLENQLAEDDGRAASLFRDFRALVKSFEAENLTERGVNSFSASEIASAVKNSFDTAVKYLQEAAEMSKQASEMRNPRMQKAILIKREELIGYVKAGLENLSKLLLTEAGSSSSENDEKLKERVREVQTALDVARRADERIRNFSKDVRREEL